MTLKQVLLAICAASAAVILASASEAEAAHGIERGALGGPVLDGFVRVGLTIIGGETTETLAARDFAASSLVAAGHQVAALPASATIPARAALLEACAAHDLDAVALVRISTVTTGWRAEVDIRDPEGRPILLRVARPQSTAVFSSQDGEATPVYAVFSFTMTAGEVAAQQQAREQAAAQRVEATAGDANDQRSRLWVSETAVMFGPARIAGADFYRLAGRPDLAARYQHNVAVIRTTRVLGYTSLGVGITTLVLGVIATEAARGSCNFANGVDAIVGQPPSCHYTEDSGWLMVPLVLGMTGGGLLAVSVVTPRDPLPLAERKALARGFNARMNQAGAHSSEAAGPSPRFRLAVSGGPSPKGDGGMMFLGGTF